MSVFQDQAAFMVACEQTVNSSNDEQFKLYCNLIDEEVKELHEAIDENDRVEQLDALLDIIVVCVGALHSMGADVEGAWGEVVRSNNAKVDPDTGKVRKREDGKVLKPENWTPPQLEQFLK